MSAHRYARGSGGPSQGPGSAAGTGFRGALAAGLGLLAAGCLPTALHAQSARPGGTVALTSQLVDRGQAITPATPVVQGELRWSSPSGWSLDVAAGSDVRSPALAEGLVQLARAWPVSANWQLQTGLLYYDAPRRGNARAYRRVEADMSWIYRDVLTLTLAALRPISAGDDRIHPALDANLHWPLTRRLSLAAGAGVARFQHGYYGYGYYGPTRSSYYRYGQAGLLWSEGRWHVELDRIATAGAPSARRGTGGLSPWLASVSWSF